MDGQVASRSPDKTLILQPILWYSLGAICRSEVQCTQSEAPVKSPPSLQDLPRGETSLFKACSQRFHIFIAGDWTYSKDSATPESYTPSVVIVCPCLPPPSPGEETVSSSLGWFQTMQLTLHFWFSCLHLLESRAWSRTRFLCCWGLNPGLCGAW